MIEKQGKADQIRELFRQGVTPPQIIARGYHKATVYEALNRGRKKLPDRALLEEIMETNLAILRLIRKITKEPDLIDSLLARYDHPDDP